MRLVAGAEVAVVAVAGAVAGAMAGAAAQVLVVIVAVAVAVVVAVAVAVAALVGPRPRWWKLPLECRIGTGVSREQFVLGWLNPPT